MTTREIISVVEELRGKAAAGRNDLEASLRFFIFCREKILSGFPAIGFSGDRILYQVEDGTRNSERIIGTAEKIFKDEIARLSKWTLRESIPALPMDDIDEIGPFVEIFNEDNPYAQAHLISDNGISCCLKFVFNATKLVEFAKAGTR